MSVVGVSITPTFGRGDAARGRGRAYAILFLGFVLFACEAPSPVESPETEARSQDLSHETDPGSSALAPPSGLATPRTHPLLPQTKGTGWSTRSGQLLPTLSAILSAEDPAEISALVGSLPVSRKEIVRPGGVRESAYVVHGDTVLVTTRTAGVPGNTVLRSRSQVHRGLSSGARAFVPVSLAGSRSMTYSAGDMFVSDPMEQPMTDEQIDEGYIIAAAMEWEYGLMVAESGMDLWGYDYGPLAGPLACSSDPRRLPNFQTVTWSAPPPDCGFRAFQAVASSVLMVDALVAIYGLLADESIKPHQLRKQAVKIGIRVNVGVLTLIALFDGISAYQECLAEGNGGGDLPASSTPMPQNLLLPSAA